MAKSGMSDSEVDGEGDGCKVPKEKKGCSKGDQKPKVNLPDDSSICVVKPAKVTTPISILIESLVKNLCSIYESDSNKAAAIYSLICTRLFQMNLIDESFNMIEFEGMRSQYQRAFYHLLTGALGGDQPLPIRPVWPNNDYTNSHYYREFDEVEYIAGGGFGQVYKVKHKLDGTEYAIKKIPIRSEGIDSVRNYLSEVKTFASMNHSNIVQYKAAWLELGTPPNEKAIMNDDSDSEYPFNSELSTEGCNLKPEEHLDEYIYPKVPCDIDITPPTARKVEESSFEVNFESSKAIKSRHYSYSNNNICSSESHTPKRVKRSSISEGGNAICKLDLEDIQNFKLRTRSHTKWATLYIQMALCQSTLKQWLERRNMAEASSIQVDTALVPVKGGVRNDTIMEILKQLLKGLEYIHFKNIVHHDIKPSNIFIQLENGTLLVQLGDFGLACPLQSVRHSLAFGTKLYAAPEQLSGKCDSKSDMYSLGIVLLELVETFRTDMERVHNITELRKGNLPPHLLMQQPQFANIITKLVSRSPKQRPDASALLKLITTDTRESEKIRELEHRLAEKEEEIMRLKELLKTAGVKSI